MGSYRYAGDGPQEDPQGGLVRPGDEREFGGDPGWGVWELLPAEPDRGSVSDSAAPATEPPAPGPDSQAPAEDATSAATSGPAPDPAAADTETQPAKGA